MLYQILTFTLAFLLVLTPLLIHELGHWAVLHRNKISVKEVWLGLGPVLFRWKGMRVGMLPIGAAVVPEPEKYKALPPLTRFWVATAGPIASLLYGLVLCAFIFLFNGSSGGKLDILLPLVYINFVLAGVNALPIPPLDGFQAFQAWREHKQRPLAANVTRLAFRLGNGFIYGVGFFVIARFFS